MDSTVQLIVETLSRISRYLERDGGSCEFVDFKDGVVYVHMLGACQGCALQDDTIKGAIETILIEEVPGVLEVVAI